MAEKISTQNVFHESFHGITGCISRASRCIVFQEASCSDAKLKYLIESHVLHPAGLNKQLDSIKYQIDWGSYPFESPVSQTITPPSN
ncbi:unnamed protein product [Penicillium discolor]